MPRGGKRTKAGRKPGSRNKLTLAAERAVKRIQDRLRRRKKLTFEDLSVELLTCGIPAVIQRELQTLREFVYSKPKQVTELTGKDGEPIETQNFVVVLKDSELSEDLKRKSDRTGSRHHQAE